MAYLPLSTLLEEFTRFIGDAYYSGTTDATGSSTTAVDSTLYGRFTRNDEVKLRFILLTSGTYSGSKRLIFNAGSTAYTASTGTMTWLAVLAGNSGNSVTYQLHGIDPQYKIDALNDARRLGMKYLAVPLVEDIVTDSPILNGGFVHWTSSSEAVGWIVNSALTLSRVSGPNAGQALNMVATGAGYANSIADYFDPLTLAGKSISVYCDVLCDVADAARIGVRIDGTVTYCDKYYDYEAKTTTTATTHPGNNRWYRLQRESITTYGYNREILGVIGSAAAITSPNYARFSKFYITGGDTLHEYPLAKPGIIGTTRNDAGFIGKPTLVEVQEVRDLTHLGYQKGWRPLDFDYHEMGGLPIYSTTLGSYGRLSFRYGCAPGSKYLMRVHGRGLPQSVSAMTDTMNVESANTHYLYACAAVSLYNRLAGEAIGEGDEALYQQFKERATWAEGKKLEFEADGGLLTPKIKRGDYPTRFA